MTIRNWTGAWMGLRWTLAQLRKPELMVFIPALTLAAFWVGGERLLIITALGAPLLFAVAGAFRFSNGTSVSVPDALGGLAMRPQVVTMMDAILRDAPVTGQTTACAVIQFDDADALLDRHGRAAQTEILTRCAEQIGRAHV